MSSSQTLDYATATDDMLGSFTVASYTPTNVDQRSHLFLRREVDSVSVTLKERITGQNSVSGKVFQRWKRTFFLHFKLDSDGVLSVYGATPRRMWGKYGNVNRHFYGFVGHAVHPLPEGVSRLSSLLAPELTLLYNRSGDGREFLDDGSLTKQIAKAIYPGRRAVDPEFKEESPAPPIFFNEKPASKPANLNQEFDFFTFEATYPKALTRYFRDPEFHSNLFAKNESDWATTMVPALLDSSLTEREYVRTVWTLHLTRRLLSTAQRKQAIEDLSDPSLDLDGPDFRAFLKRFPASQRVKVFEVFSSGAEAEKQQLVQTLMNWLSAESDASNFAGVPTLNRSLKSALSLQRSNSREEVLSSLNSIFTGQAGTGLPASYAAYQELQSNNFLGLRWLSGAISAASFASVATSREKRPSYVAREEKNFNLLGFSKAWKQERSRRMKTPTHFFRWEKAALSGTSADTPQSLLKITQYAEKEVRQALTKHGLPTDKAHVNALLGHADQHFPSKTGTRNPYGLRWFKLRKMGYEFYQIEYLDSWRVSLQVAEDMKDTPWEWIETLFSGKGKGEDDGMDF